MKVVTRFAPSPTGYLHIGGARTALFNWLFARHHGGQYKLRIEDTDAERSTEPAVNAIINSLTWLGLENDGETIFQSSRRNLHVAAAEKLLAENKAYRCYCSPEELSEMRAKARTSRTTNSYDRRWRDRDPADRPSDISPVVRIKMPLGGVTTINDKVQGAVSVNNEELDDFILLRSDGSPTYMHSVVVDDHDMEVTHVIRGDDHLNNAFRQYHLYQALNWHPPEYAHIPLIHGQDGQKLSKRHGALGVEAYKEMGYLPEAIRNYLLRLGWSYKNHELISTKNAIAWFELSSINRGPSRFDFDRLDSVNKHYISECRDEKLIQLIIDFAKSHEDIDEKLFGERLLLLLPSLKKRAKNLKEIVSDAFFLVVPPVYPIKDEKAASCLGPDTIELLRSLNLTLNEIDDWNAEQIETCVRSFTETHRLKLADIAKPLRAALTGSLASPGIFEVIVALGRNEVQSRLKSAQVHAVL